MKEAQFVKRAFRGVILLSVLGSVVLLVNYRVVQTASPRPPQVSGTNRSNSVEDIESTGRRDEQMQAATPIADPRIVEQVPAYPGAQDVVTTHRYLHQPPEVRFLTPDSLEEIRSFYKDVLLRAGWTLKQENQDEWGAGLEFTWTNPDDPSGFPYSLEFSVLATNQYDDAPTPNPLGQRYVETWTTRKPYASRIPLLPDAAQIRVEQEDYAPGDTPFVVKITQYLTHWKLEDVERFYASTLASYGWDYGNAQEGLGTISTGLVFTMPASVVERVIPSRVDITAREDQGQGTLIEIRAQGPDLTR